MKITSAEGVETSVTNNSLPGDYSNPDNHNQPTDYYFTCREFYLVISSSTVPVTFLSIPITLAWLKPWTSSPLTLKQNIQQCTSFSTEKAVFDVHSYGSLSLIIIVDFTCCCRISFKQKIWVLNCCAPQMYSLSLIRTKHRYSLL